MRASNGLIPVSTKAYRQTRKPISRVCRTYVCLYTMTRNTQKTRYKKITLSNQSEYTTCMLMLLLLMLLLPTNVRHRLNIIIFCSSMLA